MPTTFSSRKFKQETNQALKATKHGPVLITKHGYPAYVLLTISEYKKITDDGTSIVDLLAIPGIADIDFDPALLSGDLYRRHF